MKLNNEINEFTSKGNKVAGTCYTMNATSKTGMISRQLAACKREYV